MKKAKDNKKIEDKREIAIKVENVSKTFRIPHEKHTSLKAAALNIFEKKTYEEFIALQDISFEIKKGEFFGIIGRNGSGKSTLLKILAGIYMADEGTVDIKRKLSPFLELGVGFNPELTARENVFLGGAVLGLARKEIEEKFDEIIKFSELEEFIDMKFKNFSSGMQVKLAFSLSIHAHADILLMDEVLAVGDSNFQSKCIEEFRRYRKKGKTVVLVTHDTSVVQRHCDRVMLLKNGRVSLIDKPEKVVDAYVKQNSQDEEKRAEKEKPVAQRNVSKQKIAKIKQIEFFDGENKKKQVFKTGDDLSVRVYFKLIDKKIKSLNFGMGIYSSEGQHIFGTGSIMEKVSKKEDFIEKGYFQIDCLEIPLKSGTYYLKTGLFGDVNTVIYDFNESASFRVMSSKDYQGIINLKHRWRD